MSWNTVKLGDVCTIEKGKIGITKAIQGDFPLVVLGEERKSHSEFHFAGKAVIIPLVSSTGHGHKSLKRIHYQEGKFAVGNILCVVMPKNYDELDPSFLYHYLDLNKEKELVSRMKGMANVSLPIKSVFEIEIPLPPLREQQSIVEKLSIINLQAAHLDAEQTYQLDLVKQLRQAFLREAMQGKLVEQDHRDEPASELIKKMESALRQAQGDIRNKKPKELPSIKEDEIPFDIPEKWVWCRLGEIINFGPSNGFSPKGNGNERGIKCLTLTATTSGFFKEGYYKFVDISIEDSSYLWLKPNDILLQRGNSLDYVGIAALFNGKPNEFIYPDLMIKIRASQFVNSEFLHKVLISPFNRVYFQLNASGAQKSMPKITQDVVKNALIPLPPLLEQHRIVAELEQLMHLCDELEQNIRRTKEQTNMLLQAALREALRPKAEAVKLPILEETEARAQFKRAVLAAYIINQSLDDPNLGNTKFEKLLHLAEYHVIKRNFNQNYLKKAAGPYDNKFTYWFWNHIEQTQWFIRQKRGAQFIFKPGSAHHKSMNIYNFFSKQELGQVEKLIRYFKASDYQAPEIASTLFAVWNNRIILRQTINDDLLIEDFYAWDDDKKIYERARLEKALHWMREEGIIPDGWGKVVVKAESTKKSGVSKEDKR